MCLSRLERLFQEQDGFCVYCHGLTTMKKDKNKNHYNNSATLDHIIPRSKGGANHISNIAMACYKCNTRKSNRLINQTKQVLQNRINPNKAYLYTALADTIKIDKGNPLNFYVLATSSTRTGVFLKENSRKKSRHNNIFRLNITSGRFLL